MSREAILHKVRTALGRSAGQAPAGLPEARIRIPQVDVEARVKSFRAALEALAGETVEAASRQDAAAHVARILEGKTAVAANAPLLDELGITAMKGVRGGITSRDQLREACATADFGITTADYALADTGTMVVIAAPEQARLISLLPPAHIAIVPREGILSSLDELFRIVPVPAQRASSMVLITGPSRTADIEQFLVRGVHGPGTVHAVVL